MWKRTVVPMVFPSRELAVTIGTYYYIINIDDRFHSWCGNCFKVEEEAEFDVAEDEFVMLILG